MKRLNLECLPDERLVKNLGYPHREIKHHDDKGRVCNELKKLNGAIGMVDEDPKSAQPAYLEGLKEISRHHNVKLLTDAKRNNVLLVLCPRLEEWLIKVCELNGVDIKHFGLSNAPSMLHREISSKLGSLDKLLTHLLAEKKAPELKYLKEQLKGK